MDLEERVKQLENELKLLKNEVQRTLLDIKEQLIGGYLALPQHPSARRAQEKTSGGQERPNPPVPEKEAKLLEGGGDSVDLSTVITLGSWLMERARKFGTDHMMAVLELYGLTGRLPAKTKEPLAQLIRSHERYKDSDLSPQDYTALLQELNDMLAGSATNRNELLNLLRSRGEEGEGSPGKGSHG